MRMCLSYNVGKT